MYVIKIGDKTLPMAYTLTSMAEIADHPETLKALEKGYAGKRGDSIRALVWIIALLCNSAVEQYNADHPESPHASVSEAYVSAYLAPSEITEASALVGKIISEGFGRAVGADEEAAAANPPAEAKTAPPEEKRQIAKA